jgi:hypothetical protein
MGNKRGSKRKMSQKKEIDKLIDDNMGIIGIDSGLKEAIIQSDKAMEEFSLELYESMIDMAKQSLSPEQLELARVNQSMRKLNRNVEQMQRALQRPITSSRPHKSSSVRSSTQSSTQRSTQRSKEDLKELKEKIKSENKLLMNEIFYLIESWVSDPSNKGKNPNTVKIIENKRQIINNFRSIYPRTVKNERMVRGRVDKIINDKITVTRLNRLQPPSSGEKKKSRKNKKKQRKKTKKRKK